MQQICGLIVDFANELPFWGWIGGGGGWLLKIHDEEDVSVVET